MNEVVEYFFASYFHQDWRDDYSDSVEALGDFIRCEDNETKDKLLNELIKLRSREDIENLELSRFGVNFNPETEAFPSLHGWVNR